MPAALLQGSDGAFYGISAEGPELDRFNAGTVYKLLPDGSGYQTLHLFKDGDESQRLPNGPLVEGSDGALYGTTSQEVPGAEHVKQNTVFKLAKDGTGYEVLHVLDDVSGDFQWERTVAGLATGGDGVLYGTTARGGTNGAGSIFGLHEDGTGYQVLHHFGAGTDGAWPETSLLAADDGLLYGTTTAGGATAAGAPSGWGTVFRLSRNGSGYQVIHSFDPVEGIWPQGTLLEAHGGALYGTLSEGNGLGAVFRLHKDGTGFRIVHMFEGTPSFEHPGVGRPLAGVTAGPDGALYGTTSGNSVVAFENGGQYAGAVFKVWPPETPDVRSISATPDGALVTFGGESGFRYQIMRSTNLVDWSTLEAVIMPASGTFTYTDVSSGKLGAWYRIAWQP